MKYKLYYWVHLLEDWECIMTSSSKQEIENYKRTFPNRKYKVEVVRDE